MVNRSASGRQGRGELNALSGINAEQREYISSSERETHVLSRLSSSSELFIDFFLAGNCLALELALLLRFRCFIKFLSSNSGVLRLPLVAVSDEKLVLLLSCTRHSAVGLALL